MDEVTVRLVKTLGAIGHPANDIAEEALFMIREAAKGPAVEATAWLKIGTSNQETLRRIRGILDFLRQHQDLRDFILTGKRSVPVDIDMESGRKLSGRVELPIMTEYHGANARYTPSDIDVRNQYLVNSITPRSPKDQGDLKELQSFISRLETQSQLQVGQNQKIMDIWKWVLIGIPIGIITGIALWILLG